MPCHVEICFGKMGYHPVFKNRTPYPLRFFFNWTPLAPQIKYFAGPPPRIIFLAAWSDQLPKLFRALFEAGILVNLD